MRNRSIIAVTLLVIVGALAWLLIPSSIETVNLPLSADYHLS